MSLIELMIALLIALICGSIAQSLAGFSRLGCFATIALGFIGALLGSWLARLLELPDILSINIGNSQFPIVWSIIGGALFAAVLNALTPRPVR